jgi:tetratricopeptide (TPR) repeat protein
MIEDSSDPARPAPFLGEPAVLDRPPLPAMRIALVGLTVVGLWTAATFLAREAQARRLAQGIRAAELGRTSLEAGHAALAAEHFREAVALEPDRRDYRLSLARSLVALRQVDEAEPYLRDVLREDPVNGEANLELARVERARGNRVEAEEAYYRAIYGRWQASEQPMRRQARMELVGLFADSADRGRVRTALAELADAFPGDLPLQQHVARRLLAFGFAHDAARLLRLVVDRFAQPGAAYGLLAEAEFARGNYPGAIEAAADAVAHDPSDAQARTTRDLAERILSFDPAQPRLTTSARVARVRRLLEHARNHAVACQPAGAWPPGEQRVVDVAGQWLGAPARQRGNLEVGYGALEDLVALLRRACPAALAGDAAGLALARVGRESR